VSPLKKAMMAAVDGSTSGELEGLSWLEDVITSSEATMAAGAPLGTLDSPLLLQTAEKRCLKRGFGYFRTYFSFPSCLAVSVTYPLTGDQQGVKRNLAQIIRLSGKVA
jgi:hypothetical protein